MIERCRARISHITIRNWILLALLFARFCSLYSYHFEGFYKVFVLLPCGFGALLYMVVKRRIVYDRFTILLFAVCGFLTFASILKHINASAGLITLVTYYVFILFTAITPKNAEPHALRKEFTGIAAIWVCFTFPFMLTGVVSVFIGRPIQLPLANMAIGLHEPGLLNDRIGIFGNPNADARLMLISIFLAIYLLHAKLPRLVRALLYAAILVFACALTHTQSRTTIYALAIGAGAVSFHTCCVKLRDRRWRYAAGFAAWVATFAAVLFFMLALFSLDIRIACRISHTSPASLQEVSRFLTDGALDVTESGRGDVWSMGIRYILSHPRYLIFGMGSGDTMPTIGAYFHDEWLAQISHLHNAFLELWLRGGIFALAAALGAMVLLFRPCARLLAATLPEENRGTYILAVLVGILLIVAQTEVPILTTGAPGNLIFFFAAGHIMRLDREGKLPPLVDARPRK